MRKKASFAGSGLETLDSRGFWKVGRETRAREIGGVKGKEEGKKEARVRRGLGILDFGVLPLE